MPASFGCTPSPVSVASLKPVHWSTTVIGDCAVLLPLAQPGMAALSATARCGHSAQPAGASGMICATRIRMPGLLARIWSTSLLYAASTTSVLSALHTSFVPKCISTTSGRVAASQPGSWFWSATAVTSAPPWPSLSPS
jgi:hypothetical protein